MKPQLQIVGNKVILVPYDDSYVEKVHSFMEDPWLREMTATPVLSLSETKEVCVISAHRPKQIAPPCMLHLLLLTCSFSPLPQAQVSWNLDPHKLTFLVLEASRNGAADGNVSAVVGDVNIVIQQEDPSVAEVLVMIGVPECRRKGLAAAAVSLMIWYSQVRSVTEYVKQREHVGVLKVAESPITQ